MSRTAVRHALALAGLVACTRPLPEPEASETQATGTGDGDGDGEPDPGTSGPATTETTDDSDSDDGWECGEYLLDITYEAPRVVFAVDGSSSMLSEGWDHDDDPETAQVKRWSSVRGVLASIFADYDALVRAGLQRFPGAEACPDATVDAPNCYVAEACTTQTAPEVGVGLDNGAALLAALPEANEGFADVAGATPTRRAIDAAREHLLADAEGTPGHILLITDGAANCDAQLDIPELLESYDEGLLLAVESTLADAQIFTHVFGVAIEDALTGAGMDGEAEANVHARLDALALAGGAPQSEGADADQFYAAASEMQLRAALSKVLDELTSCVITVDTEGLDLDGNSFPFSEVSFDGDYVPWVDACDEGEGVRWVSEEPAVLEFCDAACDRYRLPGTETELLFGCPPPW